MSANLLPHLDALTGVPTLLLGDLMLDRYIWGSVSRISPEAPVPVLVLVAQTMTGREATSDRAATMAAGLGIGMLLVAGWHAGGIRP